MPRNTGIGMPKKRKRATAKDEKQPEEVLELEGETSDLGSTSTESTRAPTAPRTRGPSVEKAENAFEDAEIELEAVEEWMGEKDKEWRLAQRLHQAKMERFSKSVDNAKGSPTLQLERYYQAELELAKAHTKHEAAMRMVAETQAKAWEALVDLRNAEIKAIQGV